MILDNHNYEVSVASFSQIYLRVRDSLSSQASSAVEHNLQHSEIEMAIESFILSAIEEELSLSRRDKIALKDVALRVGLDTTSVFREDFWKFALPYLSS